MCVKVKVALRKRCRQLRVTVALHMRAFLPHTMPQFCILQYTFTATPVGGGTPVVVTSMDPDVRFYGLIPNTEVRMICGVFGDLAFRTEMA